MHALLRLLQRPSVGAALRVFALSRVLLFGVCFILTRVPDLVPAGGGRGRFADFLVRGDAGWYLGIAMGGYEAIPYEQTRQHNWAFFPGWPMLWRAVAAVTGEFPNTGIVLATALLLPALILTIEAAEALGATSSAARRCALYIALWPMAAFFSMPTTESLFLLATSASLLAGARGAWGVAGVLGAVASATRPNGLLLAPVLALLYWERNGRRVRADALAILLVPAGLLAFMLWMHALTGNVFASFAIQVRWARVASFPLLPLWRYVKAPFVAIDWNFGALHFAASLLAFWAVVHFARRRAWALAAYALLGVLMPLSSRSVDGIARYVMTILPVPLALAEFAATEERNHAVLATLGVLLGLMLTLMAAGYRFTFS